MLPGSIRIVAAGLFGFAVGLIVALFAPWQVATLIGWCSSALAFCGDVARSALPLSAAETKQTARREDTSHFELDVVLMTAATASLIGVGFVLAKAGESESWIKGLTTALGVISVVLAWTTVQTVFTLRYAALYYADVIGGIDFGTDEAPDYRDFAYLAFTVGMTYQVSDTAVLARPIRRTVLRHSLLSFLFATAFIAVLVNVVGGLL